MSIYIQYIKKRIGINKLKNKIIYSLIIVSIIATSSIGIISYRISRGAIIENSEVMVNDLMKQIGLNLDERINSFQDVSYRMVQNSTIKYILESTSKDPIDINRYNATYSDAIVQQSSVFNNTKYSLMKSNNGRIYSYYNSGFNKLDKGTEEEIIDQLSNYVDNVNPIAWLPFNDEVFFVRKIIDARNQAFEGYICFSMNENFFDFIDVKRNYLSNENIIILNNNQDLLQNYQYELEEPGIKRLLRDKFGDYYIYNTIINYMSEDYLATNLTTKKYEWQVISLIPISVLLARLSGISISILLVTLIVLFLSFTFTYFISKTVTKNIGVIQKGMKKIEEGDFNTRIKPANYDILNQFNEKKADRHFQGYVRPDGSVGIRNEIWIIPTVGCVNMTETKIAAKANELYKDKLDGVFAYTHNMGCSQLGTDHERTQRLLKGIINNPNAGGVLVLSLGCENNHLGEFKPVLGDYDPNRVKFLITQEVEDEYEAGMELLEELADYASTMKREEVSADKLILGFKCGGSDGFSGITANALCGRANDYLIKQGGTTILTEVPEMFGAESLLMERAVSEEVFDDIVDLINDYKKYFQRYNQTIYENPSPGNKKGGISSLEDKSLGCIQKGGNAPVVGVLDYGQEVKENGLHLLTGSGNDQVSCTNIVASGAQIIIFTTGRGNPFGSPVPTIKLSSNTELYNRKPNWIDYNAGQILDGKDFEEVTEDFVDYILDVASGVQTNNEIHGYKEISIFRDGVIL